MKSFNNLISTLEEAKLYVRKNFGDMDFENCDLRTQMGKEIEEIIGICEDMITYCKEEKEKLR